MIKRNKFSSALFLCISLIIGLSSCSDSESYAKLLDKERKSTNRYLATQRVITEIPADSIFEAGENAPFYKMDPDGNIYMQVINPGDRKNNKAISDQLVYFRFMRMSLNSWVSGETEVWDGNADDMSLVTTSFRYLNYSLSSSAQYGSGVQLPLNYLGLDCEVNLIIKSQYGFTSEISSVIPFLYKLRYFPSKV